ncbi:MAG: pyridoxamine 5'-phosphate oxidase family protein [Syntrophus sp. (in: bacteria)]|nr:pyridoxamine 5'-phosphate oxidase family protein [Syntrophus sp. (in: bacteria)]
MVFGKKETISTLDEVLESSWKQLHNGVRNFRDPFHQAVLTTMDGRRPQVRIVILREFSERERTLICHCDARGSKVLQIRDNPNASWLFYHPEKWLQLRISGTASVHTDDQVAEAQWDQVRLHHRINYCADIPPGSPTENPTSGLSGFLLEKAPKLFDVPEARKNFAAIVCRFDEMDWLLLKLTGHLRAKFSWKESGMDASWVIP